MEARGKRYAIISPAGYPDYASASSAQRQYGFIGTAGNLMSNGDDGYYIF
jgi:hypothetical protein